MEFEAKSLPEIAKSKSFYGLFIASAALITTLAWVQKQQLKSTMRANKETFYPGNNLKEIPKTIIPIDGSKASQPLILQAR